MSTYSQWWEAFAGGEFGGGYDPIAPDWTTEDYTTRSEDFYSQVVGPASGYTGTEPFGDLFGGYVASFDIESMEQAEQAFRLSIGDPYGSAALTDPYSWERISRMSPEEAQQQLSGTLYGTGEYLGGTTGAEYGTSTAAGEEVYTSGLATQREGLTYGGLTGSQSLISGTSGAVLRSGEGILQAEDILAEAYKKAKDLEAGYTEEGEITQANLEENLNDALTTYLEAIRSEKETWFNNISAQVGANIVGATFGGDWETWVAENEWAEGWEEGLLYEGGPWDQEAWEQNTYHPWQQAGWEACGIGQLIDPATGECTFVEDLELPFDSDVEPDVDEPEPDVGGCMDSNANNYSPNANVEDGSCDYEVYGCTDPSYPNSYNPEATVDDGSCLVENECGEGFIFNPSDGQCYTDTAITDQCLDNPGWVWNSATGECVQDWDDCSVWGCSAGYHCSPSSQTCVPDDDDDYYGPGKPGMDDPTGTDPKGTGTPIGGH